MGIAMKDHGEQSMQTNVDATQDQVSQVMFTVSTCTDKCSSTSAVLQSLPHNVVQIGEKGNIMRPGFNMGVDPVNYEKPQSIVDETLEFAAHPYPAYRPRQ